MAHQHSRSPLLEGCCPDCLCDVNIASVSFVFLLQLVLFCARYHSCPDGTGSGDSSVSVVTCWTIWDSNSGRGRRFSAHLNVRTSSGTGQASYAMGTRVVSRGQSNRGVKLSTRLHLMPRLEMSGTTLQLPLYAFTGWTGTALLYIPGIISGLLFPSSVLLYI